MSTTKDKEQEVFQVIADYFGDEFTEYKPEVSQILIYFPKVTVTNEYEFSIDITKLFVKIQLDGYALTSMGMTRSEYTEAQFRADYCHSHLPGISLDFSTPCLGSGPINTTVNRLGYTLNKEDALDTWNLFCAELDLFIKTESLTGGPYRKLSSVQEKEIRAENKLKLKEPIHSVVLNDNYVNFLFKILSDSRFKYSFIENHFEIAMPLFDIAVLVTSMLTNSSSYSLEKYYIKDRTLYKAAKSTPYRDKQCFEGNLVTVFKNQEYRCTILEGEQKEPESFYLLSEHNLLQIVYDLKLILNLTYGIGKKKSTFFKEKFIFF